MALVNPFGSVVRWLVKCDGQGIQFPMKRGKYQIGVKCMNVGLKIDEDTDVIHVCCTPVSLQATPVYFESGEILLPLKTLAVNLKDNSTSVIKNFSNNEMEYFEMDFSSIYEIKFYLGNVKGRKLSSTGILILELLSM